MKGGSRLANTVKYQQYSIYISDFPCFILISLSTLPLHLSSASFQILLANHRESPSWFDAANQ